MRRVSVNATVCTTVAMAGVLGIVAPAFNVVARKLNAGSSDNYFDGSMYY